MKSQKLTAEQALKVGKSALPAFIAGTGAYAPGQALIAQQQMSRCCDLFRKACEEKTPAELLSRMVQEGKVSPVVAAQLGQLEDSGASVGDYASALNRLVREGKLTPDQAKQLLTAYQTEHGPKQKSAANELLDQMVGEGSLLPEAASTLKQLSSKNVSPDDYKKALDKLVQEGKLTPEQAKKLLAAYSLDYQKKVPEVAPPARKNLVDQMLKSGGISQDTANMLHSFGASGKPASEYAAELNRLVREGKLTPDQAKQLLNDYKSAYPGAGLPKGTGEVARAAAREHAQALKAQEESLSRLQQVYKRQREEKTTAETQKALQEAQAAMSTQAKALFASWNAVPQQYVQSPPLPAAAEKAKEEAREAKNKQPSENEASIKAGTIMFAILDTAVNSDQPAPVMATIVSGNLKDTKLLGSLEQTPDGERVVLKFNLASIPDRARTLPINAVAINPDTARTAIASDVNHHYLLRYSSLFASGFLSGYSKAVLASGQQILTTQTGEVTETPDISPSGKFMVGLGEVGKQLSDVAKQTFNRKPTVRVNSGVGLGILFTNDVTMPEGRGQKTEGGK